MITKRILKTRSGFGLMEALIASGIIVMLASTSVGLSSVVIRKTAGFNDQIVANNLAAEPIEVAHYFRDKNINDGSSATIWSTGMTPPTLTCIPTSPCGLNRTSTPPSFISTPITANVNGKDYIQMVDFSSPDSNSLNIHVIVRDGDDTATLAELSSVITNWKEPE